MRSQLALLLCGLLALGGCSAWDALSVRSQSPEDPAEMGHPSARLVGDLAVPFGLFPLRVEAVGFVTRLRGTGSDPRPSPQRAVLLGEMQTRGVESPNRVLASPDTALVLVQGVLRPGIQKGDRFDVQVRIPSQSETTSLRGGWLLETRLKEMAVLNNQVHDGHTLGLVEGALLVDPSAGEKPNHVLLGRGRILGGGVALKSRNLALVLKPEHQSVRNSGRIETAVNKRFHSVHRGAKVGAAKAKTDEYIELSVHPRYKDNIQRYVKVVRAIALRESEPERLERLALLERQLLDPITASRAALQLEAIGRHGIDVLRTGIRSADPEVRFYSAEALAYLDVSDAAEPLAEAARQVPAFRVFALTALSAMEEYTALEQLRELLSVPSAETRYGAFRALCASNPHDPMVQGESLGGQFSYHVLDVAGPPMIHVTRSRRPELVVFGHDQRLHTPLTVEAGNQIMIIGSRSGEIAVSKFAVGQPDQKRTVSDRVDEVIRAIVELGGTYPDVVQALQEAKAKGCLSGRFEVDALPEAGRSYDRVADGEADRADSPGLRFLPSSPLPELFTKLGGGSSRPEGKSTGKSRKIAAKRADSDPDSNPVTAFFARMVGRPSD